MGEILFIIKGGNYYTTVLFYYSQCVKKGSSKTRIPCSVLRTQGRVEVMTKQISSVGIET